jgi:hypothetical protein
VRSISRGRFAGYVDASFLPQKQLRLGDSGQVIGRKQWVCCSGGGGGVLTLVVDPSVVWLDLAVAVVMSGGERGWRDDHGHITKCPGYKFNQNSKRIRSPASLFTFIHSFSPAASFQLRAAQSLMCISSGKAHHQLWPLLPERPITPS